MPYSVFYVIEIAMIMKPISWRMMALGWNAIIARLARRVMLRMSQVACIEKSR
jgi:hypothetical protein